MGIFSDECSNEQCDYRVRKGANKCSKCGAPAPRGLTDCGRCGAEVSTSSAFCWKCGADLEEVAKPYVIDGRWARDPEDFAVRVDNVDIEGRLSKPIIIEHGTRALLFQQGECKGEIDAGSYDMGGFFNRLNHFMQEQPATVILVDSGDITIDLENEGLWTADNFEVGAKSRLVLQLEDPDALFQSMFKGRNHITVDSIKEQLAEEEKMCMSGIVNKYPADQLFGNLELRDEIEIELQKHTAESVEALGLQLLQIRFISFQGEAYEKIRAERGKLTVEKEEADMTDERRKLTQRLRESLSDEKMHDFKSEKELEQFIRQTEHELGLKEEIREDEMKRLKRRLHFDRGEELLLRRIEIQGIQDENKRKRAWEKLQEDEKNADERQLCRLQRDLQLSEHESKKQEIELFNKRKQHEEELRRKEMEFGIKLGQQKEEDKWKMEKARQGIELLKMMKQIEREEDEEEHRRDEEKKDNEHKRGIEIVEAYSDATPEAIIAIADGPASERLAELEKLRTQENMSPEQILALTAAASPEAARALSEKYKTEGKMDVDDDTTEKLLRQQIEDQRRMSESNADRVERVAQMAMQQMGMVAGTRARPADAQQNYTNPNIPTQQNQDVNFLCNNCDAKLSAGTQFCSKCGTRQ